MGIEFINDSFEPDRPGDQNKNQNGICNRDGQYFHTTNGQQNEKPFKTPKKRRVFSFFLIL
jgi:hypothetical protein